MKNRVWMIIFILALTGLSCRIPLGGDPSREQVYLEGSPKTPEIIPTQGTSSTPIPEPGEKSTPVNLSYLYYRDAMNAWGVTASDAGDHFVQSEDGGRIWRKTDVPLLRSYVEGTRIIPAFWGDKHAWLVVSDANGSKLSEYRVTFSTDGGDSWSNGEPLDISGLEDYFLISHLTFVDEFTGWLLAHVGAGMNHDYIVIYQTQDGGKTWLRLLDPFNDGSGVQSCTKSGIWFVDPERGWLTGSCNGVAPGVFLFKTSNGGSTWDKVDLPVPEGYEPLFGLETGYCGSVSSTAPEANVIKIGMLCQQFEPQPESIYFQALSVDNGNTWGNITQLPLDQMYAYHVEDEIDLTLADVWMKSVGGDESKPVNVSPAWPGFGLAVFSPDPSHWYVHTLKDGMYGIAFSKDRGENWEVIKPKLN